MALNGLFCADMPLETTHSLAVACAWLMSDSLWACHVFWPFGCQETILSKMSICRQPV